MTGIVIGTGYWAGEGETAKAEFFELWWRTNVGPLFRHGIDASCVHVVNGGSLALPAVKRGVWHDMPHNLRHVHAMRRHPRHDEPLGGWSAALMMLCLAAYHSDADLVFVEQDCLCFGGWLPKMLAHAGDRGLRMLVGQPAGQAVEQSLLYIRKDFCLEFVQRYLALGVPDDAPAPPRMLPERKFRTIMEGDARIGWLPFGYGRSRPKSWGEDAFYVQQLTAAELEALRKAGRL